MFDRDFADRIDIRMARLQSIIPFDTDTRIELDTRCFQSESSHRRRSTCGYEKSVELERSLALNSGRDDLD